MNSKTAKQIVTKYRLMQAGAIALYLIALGVMIFVITKNIVIGILGVALLAMTFRRVFDKLLEITVEKVIFQDLDPVTFNEILKLGMFKKSMRHQVLGAMGVGDYERVFALIEEEGKKTLNPVEECNNIYRKAAIYFEQHDLENLKKSVRDFNNLKKKYAKFEYAFNKFTVFDKFDAFLDEDYEYVIGVCDIDIRDDNPKQQNHKLTKLNVSFYRAVAFYDMGDMEKAQKAFEEIVEYAPKTHKATISREYLEKIRG